MKYLVNKLSVVFLERDEEKGFNTVAYHWPTDELMAVRPKEYSVLKYISDNNGADGEELEKMASSEMLSTLVSKGILEIA